MGGRWTQCAGIAACALPGVALAIAAARGALGANPIEAITHETGSWALRFLLASLAVTPLRRLAGRPLRRLAGRPLRGLAGRPLRGLAGLPLRPPTRWNALAPWRRRFGLAAFAYATAHLATWCVLDLGLDLAAMLDDVGERPYVTLGASAFACLLALAVTSTRAAMRRLGKRWVVLHRLAYVAALLAIAHFVWGTKADFAAPLAHAAVLALLLGLRIPRGARSARSAAEPGPIAGRAIASASAHAPPEEA